MPWARSLRISTLLFVALLLVVGGGVAAAALTAGDDGLGPALASVPVAVLLVAVLVTWALAPVAVSIGAGAVMLERRLRPTRILLSEIRAVGILGEQPLRGALRTGGSGGAFGYYGRYWSRRLGPFRLFATRTDRLVLLDTASARYLLSPEPPEPFVEAVLAQAHRATRTDVPAPPPGGASVLHPLKIVLVAVGAVVAVMGVILGASWGLAPRSIRAEEGAVVVERNLASPVVIPLGEGVTVRWVCGDELGRVWRTGGVAMGRWRYGRWRSSKLGPFQLYSQRWGPIALIEGPQGRILVTPDDPAAFGRDVGIGRPSSPQ